MEISPFYLEPLWIHKGVNFISKSNFHVKAFNAQAALN